MTNPETEKLFKTLANKLVGQWYNYETGDRMTFALCPAADVATAMSFTEKTISQDAWYTLHMNADTVFTIAMQLPAGPTVAQIKLLTDDIFIMQVRSRTVIMQRRADKDYADDVIRDL